MKKNHNHVRTVYKVRPNPYNIIQRKPQYIQQEQVHLQGICITFSSLTVICLEVLG